MTEVEIIAAVNCIHGMLHVMRILKSIGLKVKLPMILKVDNSSAVNIANNWASGGRTRHMDTRV